MRRVTDVANTIYDLIPDDAGYDSLKEQISNIIAEVRYKAPEQEHQYWCEMSVLLSTYLSPDNSDWEKEIQDIFNDKVVIQ